MSLVEEPLTPKPRHSLTLSRVRCWGLAYLVVRPDGVEILQRSTIHGAELGARLTSMVLHLVRVQRARILQARRAVRAARGDCKAQTFFCQKSQTQ